MILVYNKDLEKKLIFVCIRPEPRTILEAKCTKLSPTGKIVQIKLLLILIKKKGVEIFLHLKKN